jgi:HSP20 family protein
MNLLRKWSGPQSPSRLQDPFAAMEEVMNRMMNAQFENWPSSMKSVGPDFHPHIEVKENKEGYSVSADLPGLKRDDIELSFNRNALTIRGEKKLENEKKEGEKVHYSERYYGSFLRTVPFSEEIEESKIEASYDDGVLKVYLAKKPTDSVKGKSIPVR